MQRLFCLTKSYSKTYISVPGNWIVVCTRESLVSKNLKIYSLPNFNARLFGRLSCQAYLKVWNTTLTIQGQLRYAAAFVCFDIFIPFIWFFRVSVLRRLQIMHFVVLWFHVWTAYHLFLNVNPKADPVHTALYINPKFFCRHIVHSESQCCDLGYAISINNRPC